MQHYSNIIVHIVYSKKLYCLSLTTIHLKLFNSYFSNFKDYKISKHSSKSPCLY